MRRHGHSLHTPALGQLQVLENRSLLTVTLTFTGLAGGQLDIVDNTLLGAQDTVFFTQNGANLEIRLPSGVRFAAGSTGNGGGLTYFSDTGFQTTPQNSSFATIGSVIAATTSLDVTIDLRGADDTLTIGTQDNNPARISAFFASTGVGFDQVTITNSGLHLDAFPNTFMFLDGDTIAQNDVTTAAGAVEATGFTFLSSTQFIDLTNPNNDFQQQVVVNALQATVLINASDDVQFGNVTADTLVMNLSDADLTQTAGSSIRVTNSTDLDVGTGDVTFPNLNNDFGSVAVRANNATLTDIDDLTFEGAGVFGSVLTGTLDVTADGVLIQGDIAAQDLSIDVSGGVGNIDDFQFNPGFGYLNISGSTTLNLQATDDVRLGLPHNFHGPAGSLTIVQANDITVRDTGALNVDLQSITGNATITAAGAVTDAGMVNVLGTTTISANGNVILDNPANDQANVRVNSGVTATIVDLNDLIVSGINATGPVSVSTNGFLQVTGDVSGTTVGLTAGEGAAGLLTDHLTIGNVRVQATSGDVSLQVADNLVVSTSATISAAAGASRILIQLDNLNDNDVGGSTANLVGNYIASRIEVTGGLEADRVDGSTLATTPVSIIGDAGDDTILGGEADDTISGGGDNDSLIANGGADLIDAGDGNDTVEFGLGNDSVTAGLGTDMLDIFYQNGTITADAGDGDDVITITDSRSGQAGSVTINAGIGDDQISAVPLLGPQASVNGVPLVINGGNPAPPGSPGDSLLLNLIVSNPSLGTTIQTGPNLVTGDGSVTFSEPRYGDITFTSIEELISNDDPNPVYDADGPVPNPVPPVPSDKNDGLDDTFDLNIARGIVNVLVNGATVDRLPLLGLQSITFNGSGDDDLFIANQSAQALSFNLNLNGNVPAGSGDQDRAQFVAGAVTGATFRPTGAEFAAGTVDFGGMVVTTSGMEITQFEAFANVSVTPFQSDNHYELRSGTTTDITPASVPSLDIVAKTSISGAALPSSVKFVGVPAVSINTGASDGAAPNDSFVITDGALRNEPALQSLLVQTGTGSDTVEIQDGDFRLSAPGGGIILDGGVASDVLRVIPQEAVPVMPGDAEFAIGFTLSQNSLSSNAGGVVTSITLTNFAGEHAVLTGNSSNNVFDLSGWNLLATAVVNGLGGTDTLTALNDPTRPNQWNISAANQGDVGGFAFSSVENLNGASNADDRFIFGVNGTISGQIFAGGGTDTLNFSAHLTPVSFQVFSNDPSGYQGNSPAVAAGFVGIDSIAGGGHPEDVLTATLTSPTIGVDENTTWEIDGTNTLRDNRFNRVLAFSAIETLQGGSGNDTFLLTGTQAHQIRGNAGNDTLRFQNTFSQLVGRFDAGSGSDTLDLQNYSSARTVTLTGHTVDGFSGTEASITQNFTGVDTVFGSVATTDTIIGLDVASQWLINGVNRGSYTDSNAGRTLTFGDVSDATGVRGFENLNAGSGFDTFTFTNGGTIAANINGGGNFDTLIGDGSRASEQFVIDTLNGGTLRSGAIGIIGSRFSNIETLIGGSGQDSFTFTNTGSLDGPIDGVGGIDTLVGDNDGNAFNVTQNDAGLLAGKVFLSKPIGSPLPDFVNMETLVGGSGTDTFLINAILVGDVSGQTGNDTFTFTTAGAVLGSVLGGTGTDTLIGDNDGNLFNVTGDSSSGTTVSAIGRGNLTTKTTLFTDIENLVGGDGDDSFVFSAFGSINGTADGRADGAIGDTLTGDDDGNFFTVTTANSGGLLGKLTGFSAIENLLGGGGDDTFAVNANLGTPTVGGNISGFVGRDTVLVGPGAIVYGSVNTHELADTIDVRGRIVGPVDAGIDNDVFILQNGAVFDSQVTGNSGNDSFTISGTVTLNNPLRGGSGDDTFAFAVAGNINQDIDGEAGNDTLVGDDDGNAFTVSAANAGNLPGHGDGDFVSIENLTGGLAADTFAINATLSGSVSALAGNDQVTVAAGQTVGGDIDVGDGTDSVTVNTGAVVAGTIRGGTGDDTLNVSYAGTASRTLTFDGGTGTDVLRLTGSPAASGTTYTVGPASTAGTIVTAGANTQTITFTTSESVEDSMSVDALTIVGSNNADTINVINAATAGFTEVNFNGAFRPYIFQNKPTLTINSQGGNDTINLNNPNPATGLTATNANGEIGNDTINVRVNVTGNLTGGDGDDAFIYTNGTVVTGLVDGDAGTDTINASAYTSPVNVALTSEGPNGFNGNAAALASGGFNDIDSIASGASTDSLTNNMAVFASWEIDGSNRFVNRTTGDLSSGRALAFSAFELLNGGSDVDEFYVSGSRANTLTGGAGADQLLLSNSAVLLGSFDGGANSDTLSFAPNVAAFTPYTSNRAVTLTSNAADGYSGTTAAVSGGFSNIDNIVGGAAAGDSLTGMGVNSTWELDGTNRYIDNTTTRAIAFSAIEDLIGAGATDVFVVTGAQTNNVQGGAGDDTIRFTDGATLTGTIDGGSESDVVDFQLYTTAVTANAGAYTNIEEIIGGSTALDLILGGSGNDTFVVNDTNQGTVNGIAFSSFENVDAQGGTDSISFVNTGTLAGSVNGGSGTDTLNLAGLPGTPAVVLTALGALDGFNGTQFPAIGGNFQNINALVGKGSDSLTGLDSNATWTLAATETYASGANTLTFSGYSTLIGGSAIDTFNVNTSITRTLRGQDGADAFNLAAGVTLTGSPLGGPGNDQFLFGNGAAVTGFVDGGADSDTVSFATSSTAVTITVGLNGSSDGFMGSVSAISGGFDNVNAVAGSTSSNDALAGRNAVATWTVSGSSTYTDTLALGRTLGFSGLENLNGGNLADTFNISGARTANLNGNSGDDNFNFTDAAARLTGTVAGGTGNDSLSFAGLTTAANLTLTGNTVNGFGGNAGSLITAGFTAIDNVTGGAAADTLTGQDTNATWRITGTDTYTDNGTTRVLNFVGYENLTGGNSTDTFIIESALAGSISGQGDGDVVDLRAGGSVGGNITTGNGNDEFFLHVGGIFNGSLDAGADNDLIQIEYTGTTARNFTVNAGSGLDVLRLIGGEPAPASNSSLTYTVGPSSAQGTLSTTIDGVTQSFTFDGISPATERIEDRQTVDNIVVAGSTAADTINVVDGQENFTQVNFNNAFAAIEFQNKLRLQVNGLSNADTINLNNSLAVTNVNHATGLTTIGVDGGDGSDIVNVSVDHTGDLVGGNGDDRFVFANGITITGETADAIRGGSGRDTIDLSAWTTAISVSLTGTNSSGFTGTSAALIQGGGMLTGIDSLAGTTQTDFLNGLAGDATWQIDGTNTYTEDATNRTISFSSFEFLNGNSGIDTFQVFGAQSGTLNGQAGNDVFRFMNDSAVLTGGILGDAGIDTLDFGGFTTTSASIVLSGLGFLDGFDGSASPILTASGDGFTDINAVIGGSATTDAVSGLNVASTWGIDGTNTYTENGLGTILSFSNIENLNGGSNVDAYVITGVQTVNISAGDGDDTVLLNDGAAVNGSLDGGDNTTASPGDTLDYSPYSTPILLNFSSFINFETVLDSGSGSDTLEGTGGADLFEINNPNAGTINGVAFSGFENLDGLGGNDSFTFTANTGSLSGSIQGGAGSDTVSFSGITGSVDFTLTGLGLVDGYNGDETGAIVDGFTNINTLVGSAGTADTLLGRNVDSTWAVSTTSSYTSNGVTLNFSAIETLNSQNGADTFNVTGTAAANINSNGGADVVNLAAGASLTGSVNLDADNDRLAIGNGASITGSVTFGAGNDTLDLTNQNGAQSVALTAANAGGGFDGSLAAVPSGFIGAETLVGGNGNDTLTGLNAVSTWTINTTNSTYASSGSTLTFSRIENAVGGNNVDTFNANTSATINLAGGDGADAFNVAGNVSITGTLNGGAGNDTFTFQSVVVLANTVFDGGADNDTLDLSGGVTAVSLQLSSVSNVETVIGTTLGDTLVGTTGADLFNIAGANNNGNVGGLTFQSFENLQGGAGNDEFAFANGFGVSGAIDGGSGNDELDYSNYATGVSVNLVLGTSTNVTGGTSNIENATGGSGNDTLTGNSGNNTLVGNNGDDSLIDGMGNDSLDGGANNDIYILTPGSSDVVSDASGVDRLDFSQSAGPIVIDLGSASAQVVLGSNTLQLTGIFENVVGSPANDTITAADIGSARSINGGGGNDTFRTADNTPNTWTITGADQGTLANITLQSIENLVGGTNDDAFNFNNGASLSGTIDGGAHFAGDEVNYSAYTTAVTVNLASLTNIESVTGGSTGNDTLAGANSATVFNVAGPNSGSAGGITFTGFENLTGGTDNDTFNFDATGSLSGTAGLDGGAGSNTLNLSGNADSVALTAGSSVGFTGTVTATTAFTNVTSLNGGTGSDMLSGMGGTATWGIDGTNDYQNSGKTLAFSDIENLVGGAGADTFNIAGSQTIELNGGGGDDTFAFADGAVLNGTANGASGTDRLVFAGPTGEGITLIGAGATDGYLGASTSAPSFTNIDSVAGSTGTQDSLQGTGAAASWNLNSSTGNTYVEGSLTLRFSGIDNLIAGALGDTFNITGAHAANLFLGAGDDSVLFLANGSSLSGNIDGGAGTDDRVDYSALSATISVDTNRLTAVERVIGGASAGDTLIGRTAGSTFAVTGANSGTVDGIIFGNFETLSGAAGADVFDFAAGGSVLAVNGAAGGDTLDLADTASDRSVTLTSASANGFTGSEAASGSFTGIDTVIGRTNGNDAISGINSDGTWTINGGRTYLIAARTLSFPGFETINGNASRDTFNLSGTPSININAGGGNDSFVLANNTTVTGNLSGDAGTDTLDLSAFTSARVITLTGTGTTDGFNLTVNGVNGSVSNIDSVASGSGSDTLNGLNVAAVWSIGATGSYTASSRTLSTSSIETRVGGTDNDTFNIQANALSATTHAINGGAGSDTFNLNFAAGTSIVNTASLSIIGGSPASTPTNSDTVNVNVNQTGDGARSIGLTYTSNSSGNVTISGLGTSSTISLTTIEKLNVNGDSANNDTVTVLGTTAADTFTVTPQANGATVLLNGGTATASTGPDMALTGLSTTGFNIDGSDPSGTTGDVLLYNGTGTATISSSSSGRITGTGAIEVGYTSIEDLDPLNPLTFVIDAQAAAGNGVADTFDVSRSNGQLLVQVNSGTILNEELADVAALIINGSNDDDTLSVSLAGGNPLPAGGLTFNASGQVASDAVIVTGTAASTMTYAPSSTTNGSGTLNVDGSTLQFSGVEPVTASSFNSVTVVTPRDADAISIDSPSVGSNRISGTSGGLGISSLTFSQVTTVVLDAATNAGGSNDTVTFAADVQAGGLIAFTVTTGNGNDTINASVVTSFGLALNGGAGNDTITGGGGNDSIAGGSGTDLVIQTASGTQTLTSSQLAGRGTDSISSIEVASLTGSAGDDLIDASGFSGSTFIEGLDGNNTILGGSGADFISNIGMGNDSVVGNDGNDTIFGGGGRDNLNGGIGNDMLFGQGSSGDILSGGEGNDTLDGGAGNDTLMEVGGSNLSLTNTSLTGLGTDVLTGLEQANLALTAAGQINVTGFTNSLGTTLYGTAGNDTITGGVSRDVILGLDGNDSLIGNDGNDVLLGSSGRDTLNGGAGHDMLQGQGASGDQLTGGVGDDTLDGGAGNDTLIESADVNFTLTNSSLTGLGTDVVIGIELASLTGGSSANVINASGFTGVTGLNGGDGDDQIIGGSGTDIVSGGAGNDTLTGNAGDDTLTGDAGNDSLSGGDGSDAIRVTANANLVVTNSQATGEGTDAFDGIEAAFLTGGAGNNVLDASGSTLRTFLNGEGGNDTLVGGSGNDVLNGGAGTDFTTLMGSNIVLTNAMFSGAGIDQLIAVEGVRLVAEVNIASRIDASAYTLGSVTLIGGAANDTLLGGSGSDSLDGGDGNDSLSGGAGADVAGGGVGLDVIRGGDGNDVLNGGSDNDTIFGEAGNDQIAGGSGNDSLEGGAGTDSIAGEQGNDVLRGGDDNDTLDGGRNNDTLYGEAGDDSLYGDLGEDGMNGGIGNDFLLGDFGNDTLLGLSGNDTLLGSADDDTCIGGDGNDNLNGNGGNDKLAGNAGTDTIVGTAGEIDEAFTENMFPGLL